MDILYNVMTMIRKRPNLYLGETSLIRLDLFLSGYEYRQNEIDPDYETIIPDMPEFNEFVSRKFGCDIGTKSPSVIILEHTKSDEEAFHKYFELLDQYFIENDIQVD